MGKDFFRNNVARLTRTLWEIGIRARLPWGYSASKESASADTDGVQSLRHSRGISTHLIPLLLFAILATLIEAPLIAFPHVAGDQYESINIAHFGTDEHYYLARAKEVADGGGLGNPFMGIHKESPDPTGSYVEAVLTFPIRVTGLTDAVDIVEYYNVLNFLGIITTLVAMYAFAFALSGNRMLATAVALCAVGGYSIIYHKWLFYTDFNIYGRSVYPYTSSIPFFTFLLLAYRTLVEKKNWWYVVGAGLLFGLLFYDYFYAWTYTMALLGSLFLTYAFKRDWLALKKVLGISIVGVFLGIPAILSILRQFFSDAGEQLTYFYFTAETHMFVWSTIGAASTLVLALYTYFHRNKPSTPFILALIMAGWVALNQQVITGHELNHGHYYWYFVVPVAIIIGGYMLWRLLPKRWPMYFCGFLIVLTFINTAGGQYQSFPTTYETKLHEQLYAPVLADLRTLPYGVVFTDPGPYSYLVPIYTHNDLYFASGSVLYYMPIERITDTLLSILFLDTASRADPRTFLEKEIVTGEGGATRLLYSYLEGYYSGYDFRRYNTIEAKHPDEGLLKKRSMLLNEIENKYKKSFSTGERVQRVLTEGGVRYILWDKSLYTTWDITSISGTSIVKDYGQIVLYALSTTTAHSSTMKIPTR